MNSLFNSQEKSIHYKYIEFNKIRKNWSIKFVKHNL